MSGRVREVSADVLAHQQAKLTVLGNQARLAQEQLELAVADCLSLGISSRRIAPWLDVAHATVNRMGARGREASDRRGGIPAEQGGQRGAVGRGTGD